MGFPKKVFVREVGPREGLQTMSAVVPTAKKLHLIEKLSGTGVQEIEITSMVRPDRVPQMADADEFVAQFKKHGGVRYTALYLNRKGFERAEALGRLDNQAWLYTATSDTFLAKNSNTSRKELLADVDAWLELFAASGRKLHGVMISTAFGCAYEGSSAAQRLVPVAEEMLSVLGKKNAIPIELSLADTVGMASPEAVRAAVRDLRLRFPGIRISLHLHDTRGTGIANAYAGLLEGVDCFDASVGGVGGCPFTPGAAGNIATEDLVYLCHELGIETGIALENYVKAAEFLAEVVGHALPGRYYRAAQRRHQEGC